MHILKAIADPRIFRSYVSGKPKGALDSWKNWATFLKVLYGLPLAPEDYDVVRQCTGRDPAKLGAADFQECLLLCGRRSGKSKVIALVAAFEAILSGREKRVSAGEIPMVAVVSPTRNQSRIIHTYLRGVFDSSELLKAEVAEEKRDSFVLRNGVEVAIIAGDPRVVRGFTLIAAIVDEIAHFGFSEESKVRSDTELIRSLRPALATTEGRLFTVGTPHAAKGFTYETWKRAYGNDGASTLCWNAPSLLMNLSLPKSVVDRAMEEDPIAARSEFCIVPGAFRDDIEAFVSRDEVEALIIPGRKKLQPAPNIRYGAFADVSGGRADDAALAIAHKEGRMVVIDRIDRFPSPHNPYEIVARMVETLRSYGCKQATGDAYSAEWSRMLFDSYGIKYNRATKTLWNEGMSVKNKIAKPKSVLYAELLPRLTSGEIELLDNESLVTQLYSLERRTRSGGRDIIDHPPGGKDDIANVVAGVCDVVTERIMSAGLVGHDYVHNQHELDRQHTESIREVSSSDEEFRELRRQFKTY